MIVTADKEIIRSRFKKNFETYNKQATIQQKIASRMVDLLVETSNNHLNRVLEIGCGTGFLTQKVLEKCSANEYILNDIVDSAYSEVLKTTKDINFNSFKFIAADAETAVFPNNLNAVISTSTFQWFNNIESFINRIKDSLNSDGLLAFSTFGSNNYNEIRTTLGVGLDYKTLYDLSLIVKSNFDIIHVEEWTEQMIFDCPTSVLKHMKLTGVNGLKPEYLGRNQLEAFNEKYLQLFSNSDGTVNLTYHPIILIAKKKHER